MLDVDRLDTDGVVQERKKIIADTVFLNAGSAGTTRLLVKARARDLIPRSARRRMPPGGSNRH